MKCELCNKHEAMKEKWYWGGASGFAQGERGKNVCLCCAIAVTREHIRQCQANYKKLKTELVSKGCY